jgi:hypothetical protein
MSTKERRKRCFGVVLTGGLALTVVVVLKISTPQPGSPTFLTNTVLQVSQIHWQPIVPRPTRSQWEGIEPAERINEQMMRRYQERWKRSQRFPVPLPPTLPGTIEEGQ